MRALYGPELRLYPGQSQMMQLRQADGGLLVLAVGTVISAIAVDCLQRTVCDLAPQVSDAGQGLVLLTVPDNPVVWYRVGRLNYYDVRLVLPSNGGTQYLATGDLELLHSPTGLINAPIESALPLFLAS